MAYRGAKDPTNWLIAIDQLLTSVSGAFAEREKMRLMEAQLGLERIQTEKAKEGQLFDRAFDWWLKDQANKSDQAIAEQKFNNELMIERIRAGKTLTLDERKELETHKADELMRIHAGKAATDLWKLEQEKERGLVEEKTGIDPVFERQVRMFFVQQEYPEEDDMEKLIALIDGIQVPTEDDQVKLDRATRKAESLFGAIKKGGAHVPQQGGPVIGEPGELYGPEEAPGEAGLEKTVRTPGTTEELTGLYMHLGSMGVDTDKVIDAINANNETEVRTLTAGALSAQGVDRLIELTRGSFKEAKTYETEMAEEEFGRTRHLPGIKTDITGRSLAE